MAVDLHWYQDAIFYELHVKAFADGNSDGVGDIQGLIRKLDYLKDLGVTCIWLLPMYPSPMRDDGYDISDYRGIAPQYGSLEEFQKLVDAAHIRDIKILMELVLNHSSDQHPWFQSARSSPQSPYRDWYVFSDRPDRYSSARIIFSDTETSNWTWDPIASQYYWHRFFASQPDLNFDHPEVREEFWQIMKFWLDMGVDGFRVDAVPYLFEREGTNCENLPETHALLKMYRQRMDAEYPGQGKILLAEANQEPEQVREYFGEADEFHMCFHFPVMPRLFMAIRLEDRKPLITVLRQTPEIPDGCQWGLFLRNHDELTLEMVTELERDYMWDEYAQQPAAKLNLGIRRRLAPLLDNNRRCLELMYGLLFSLNGSPFIYYGDEIGMGDNLELGDRNGVRTPMQWDSSPNAGFSAATAAQLYLPVVDDPFHGPQLVNVQLQRASPTSLWSWIKTLIRVRKSRKAFGRGSLDILEPGNHRVIAIVRRYQNETILILGNLSRHAQIAELNLAEFSGAIPIELFGGAIFPRVTQRPYVFTMAPHSFFWLELRWFGGVS
jgi:maltose alpha-D-glucosyltransferase/alpha-amylase